MNDRAPLRFMRLGAVSALLRTGAASGGGAPCGPADFVAAALQPGTPHSTCYRRSTAYCAYPR